MKVFIQAVHLAVLRVFTRSKPLVVERKLTTVFDRGTVNRVFDEVKPNVN